MSTRPAAPLSDVLPATRAGAVASELRRLIRSGELGPGDRLRQNEIAARFGVSTTPVREAFTSLAREGLVTQDAHRGVIVFAPSPEDIRENYEIRIALESLAAELAARNITAEELDELDELIAQMRVAILDDTVTHATVLNPRFHAIVNDASRRPRLIELIGSMRDAAIAFHSLLAAPDLTAEYADAVGREHEEIVAALRARAPKRAARAVRAHIEHNMREIIEKMPAPAV
jgi:DNA-binding GntR family transcriptional regulator